MSKPTRSRSVTRRPLMSRSVFDAAAAPKPRMSTCERAPLTPPNRLVTWTPGSRDRMSCSEWLGERAMSAEVMTVDEAPVMMVPVTMPDAVLMAGPEGSLVAGVVAGVVVGARVGAGVTRGVGSRAGAFGLQVIRT